MSFYENNIRLLAQKDAMLANRVRAAAVSERCAITPARSGQLTMKVQTGNGSDLLLHSAYDPLREARSIVSHYTYNPTCDLVILGIGLGYHIHEILAKKHKHGLVMLVESDIAVFKYVLRHVDMARLIAAQGVVFCVEEKQPVLFKKLREHSISILANSLTILEYSSCVKMAPDYFKTVRALIEEFVVWTRVNVNTQMAKAEYFARNIFDNMDEIIANNGIRALRNVCPSAPAFVVSAGPSLDKNISFLRFVGDRGIIIAVDSAAKALLNNGITPDIIVSIDFGEHNVKYLANVARDDLLLAFDPEVYPAVVRGFKGKKAVIAITGKSLCDWVGEHVEEKGGFEKGLSVSHTAFHLALYMGCDPVVFVGQDLSFPHGSWHHKGSDVFQHVSCNDDIGKRMVSVPGYFGKTVQTDTALRVFLSHFEVLLEGVGQRCFNATEGGARIQGLQPIALRDAIKTFCVAPVDKSFVASLRHGADEAVVKRAYHAAKESAAELEEANHIAYEAFQLIERMMRKLNERPVQSGAIMALYKELGEKIVYFMRKETILQLLKDNATEALILRAKRHMVSLRDADFEHTDQVVQLLNKERLFFTVLVKATDFLSSSFCAVANRLERRLSEERIKSRAG